MVVERLFARHGRDVLALLALRIIARPAYGMDNIVGGYGHAVVKP
jgi:hypothetical protein